MWYPLKHVSHAYCSGTSKIYNVILGNGLCPRLRDFPLLHCIHQSAHPQVVSFSILFLMYMLVKLLIIMKLASYAGATVLHLCKLGG
jgi:hypothetical protein